MTDLRHVLVGSDLSPGADYALGRALRLATQHRARLTILHVIESAVSAEGRSDWELPDTELRARLAAGAEADARRELQARYAQFAGTPAVSAEVRIASGLPFHEIIRSARETDANLVVLGAHGRAFLHDLLLGTTTERVVRKGQTPVLVVRRPEPGTYRRALAAADFSEPAAAALRIARRILGPVDWHLLHAYELPYEDRFETEGLSPVEVVHLHQRFEQAARARLETFARDAGFGPGAARLIVQHGYPGTTITSVAERLGVDVVVIGTRGLTGLPHILLGSVAEHVLRESATDVLVVPARQTGFSLP